MSDLSNIDTHIDECIENIEKRIRTFEETGKKLDKIDSRNLKSDLDNLPALRQGKQEVKDLHERFNNLSRK